MRFPPLLPTFCVLVVFALLAVPLRRLTGNPAVAAVPPAAGSPPVAAAATPCWLKLRLLDPAESVVIGLPEGRTVWSAGPLEAGEHETQAELPLAPGGVDLLVKVRWPAGGPERALFLTLAPDGFEERTDWTIGAGDHSDLLEFHWHVSTR